VTTRRGTVFRLTHIIIAAVLTTASLFATEGDSGVLKRATGEVPEERLLDVNILIFNSGVEAKDSYKLESKGIFDGVRKAESRFIPVTLMETLQSTGFWGAVRLAPQAIPSGEVTLRGTILKSTGLKLVVEIEAEDSTGRTWFKRKYKQPADWRSYNDEGFYEDPFYELYNRIANDLLAHRVQLQRKRITEIRQVAQLRFASDMAPEVFADYLKQKRNGKRFQVSRLPSEDDPMMARVNLIGERDAMLIDTLTAHYQDFQVRMFETYHGWREASFQEELALRTERRKARAQQILGAAAILGAIFAEGDSNSSRAVQEAAVIGGSLALQSGIAKQQELKIHKEALAELAASLDAEMEPLLVDLKGNTLRLTGTAEEQYQTWRDMLKSLFLNDLGLPLDPNHPQAEKASAVPEK